MAYKDPASTNTTLPNTPAPPPPTLRRFLHGRLPPRVHPTTCDIPIVYSRLWIHSHVSLCFFLLCSVYPEPVNISSSLVVALSLDRYINFSFCAEFNQQTDCLRSPEYTIRISSVTAHLFYGSRTGNRELTARAKRWTNDGMSLSMLIQMI